MIMLFVSIVTTSCNQNNKDSEKEETKVPAISKENLENEAWEMEEQYWDYVLKMDTVAYKKLWHDDFIGYPNFGDGVAAKSGIAVWIPELHQDPSLKYSYKLFKKAANAIGGVVIVFYDADYLWTDKDNNVIKEENKKFTHTWKRYGDTWLIIGGMAAER